VGFLHFEGTARFGAGRASCDISGALHREISLPTGRRRQPIWEASVPRHKTETTINFVCDDQLRAAVRKLAIEQDRTMSAVMRTAARMYLASAEGKSSSKSRLRSEVAA
jgi:Ribbon-helix-helix protein, copG family